VNDQIIQTTELTRHFGDHIAVDRLNVQIAQGEVFGFLGPNGAGKTTTVRLLNGVLAASSGAIQVFGLDPARQGSQIRQRTGVLTESPALYEALTARENLLIFGELYDVPASQLPDRASELLELFGLAERADDPAGSYSKGMKQRLSIARALIHDPELLFLDEPTSGLDPAAARQVQALIETLAQEKGRSIFLCTHNLLEAQRLCDRVGVISRGRLIAVGAPSELAGQLWHGEWIDIELGAPPVRAVVDAVATADGVLEANLDGETLGIHLEGLDRTPAVVAAIVGAGGDIYRVTPREHTLEDIYFELQENDEA
jgi:ABC-2 type transport system ATP-binding protein